ncbi:MAG: ABC transporter ATP-binding protein [Armatimonadetes bacterium]|nr:ABC transporter ATP-binding protein [Armatimonadota bacterium]
MTNNTARVEDLDGVPAPGPALVRFTGAAFGYGRHRVLSDLSFAIHAGDYLGIVGPNGAGKTTLLKGVLGVLRPQSGRVERRHSEGRDLRFGYVPQINTVDETYPLTALDVALMGRYGRIGPVRRPGKEDRQAALEALEQVGIADLARRLYRDLSGGQRQRVLMARALACEPDILVLDEPTNDMDIAAESATMELIGRLHREERLAILLVSHMLNLVAAHARQIAFLGVGRFEALPAARAVTARHLERLYGTRVSVAECDGRRVVLW